MIKVSDCLKYADIGLAFKRLIKVKNNQDLIIFEYFLIIFKNNQNFETIIKKKKSIKKINYYKHKNQKFLIPIPHIPD